MPKLSKKNILPQMHDIRPADRAGAFGGERIGGIDQKPVSGQLSGSSEYSREETDSEWERLIASFDQREAESEYGEEGFRVTDSSKFSAETSRTDDLVSSEETPYSDQENVELEPGHPEFAESEDGDGAGLPSRDDQERWTVPEGMAIGIAVREFIIRHFKRSVPFRRATTIVGGVIAGLGLVLFVGSRLETIRGSVLGESIEGMKHISVALEELSQADFDTSSRNFREARDTFASASDSLGTVGRTLARVAGALPPLSRVSSGQALLEGAEHLSATGEQLARIASLLSSSTDTTGGGGSLLPVVGAAEEAAEIASGELARAEEAFSRVDPEDVPESERDTFLSVRDRLPEGRAVVDGFREHSFLIRELLGENGPRLYLFLFQNNHELRPTGGFIGSYGLLSVRNGRVENLFVDGIFNPDGQFRENIVPPRPMRKMTAAWSLHDSNWWPDFPTSARKAVSFYEKTGGPTVDGIVALTPVVLRDMLRVTGPIDMPEYGVTIDADNFMPIIQEEVEVNYDREENRPKKILSDLTPILLERLTGSRDPATVLPALEVLSDALSERQILLYSRNDDIESLLSRAGWSGELLPTDGDYASVVHTNINGFKTDGVIGDTVEHSADIRADGSVVDTIRITRKHTGGDTGYDWWDRVNSDYMRVYVPKGSELLSASGATYEFIDDPIDYDALGFSRDPDLERDERGTAVDGNGTRISEENGKTVFGNWVYVSPGESVTVEYTYLLPFRVFPGGADEPASYSFLYQKQAGLEELAFRHDLSYPDRFVPVWHSEGTEEASDGFSVRGMIRTDAYSGTVFIRN